MEQEEEILNVVERWESLGLLEGLPIQDKCDLALIYDNATRLLLSQVSIRKIPKKISDILDEVYLPICRRLYRRVGVSFNLEVMMGELLETINQRGEDILKSDPNEPEKNPIISFCVEFSDDYEDDETRKHVLTDDEYINHIKGLISKLEEVLLNNNIVSYVNKGETGYELNISKTKASKQRTRYWNQSVAKKLMENYLSNLNKGN